MVRGSLGRTEELSKMVELKEAPLPHVAQDAVAEKLLEDLPVGGKRCEVAICGCGILQCLVLVK